MKLELTETQTLIRDTARQFARERVAPQARRLDREEHFPTELMRELASLGLMGVNLPAKYGGAEAGVVAYALAMMEMAAACASTSVTVTSASTPDASVGQAVDDTVPQFMPHIMESPVSTLVICPASSDAFKQAAVVGSTVMTEALY